MSAEAISRLDIGPAADDIVEVEPPAGDPSEELEKALFGLAAGYSMAGYKVRRRQGQVTFVPVERTFPPNKLARALVTQRRRGGRALLGRLGKTKRGKR